jgi:hypothetical protein
MLEQVWVVQLEVGVVVVEVEVGVLRVFLVNMVMGVVEVEVNEVGVLQVVVVAGLVRQYVSPPCSRPLCRPGDPFSGPNTEQDLACRRPG